MTLETERRNGTVVVPAPALVVEGARRVVYIVRDGTAHRVEVQTGLDDGTEVEIRSGLQGGEQLVVAGKESLADGKPVEVSSSGPGKS